MVYNVLMGTLNPTHSLTHSLTHTCITGSYLPDDLRDPSLSADNFRKRLKTHLFRNALGHVAH